MSELKFKQGYGTISQDLGTYTFKKKSTAVDTVVVGKPKLFSPPGGGLEYRFDGQDVINFNTTYYDVSFSAKLAMPSEPLPPEEPEEETPPENEETPV